MTVAEAIKLLSDEDQSAELVMVPHSLRNQTISQLEYYQKYYWIINEVAGRDSTKSATAKVVLIGNRSDE